MHTAPDVPLLERIAACQRACVALGREVLRVPGFLVAVAGGHGPGLAVAVPDDDAPPPSGPAFTALAAAFASRGADPAIEYVEELQPALADVAHAAGWRTTSLVPLMVLAPAALVAGTPAAAGGPSAGDTMRLMQAEDAGSLEAYLRGQYRAYVGGGGLAHQDAAGDDAPSDDAPGDDATNDHATSDDALAYLPIMRLGLPGGAMAALAVERDGRFLAGASLLRGAGVSELAGVWTLPEARRQGLARAACAALLAHGFATGDAFAWLSAAPDAAGLYRSLGFDQVGHQRNLDLRRAARRPALVEGGTAAIS